MRALRLPTLFRNRDYLLLSGGQAISSTGSMITDLALPLLVLAQTRSAAAAGLVVALRALPALLLTLPAGAAVDRWDRRRTMIWSDAGRAVSLASIPIALGLGRLTLAQICLVALCEGSLAVLFGLAEAACLPRVVPEALLGDAVAQSEFSEGAVTLLGPPLGGLLFAAGRALPFLVDALSYAVSIVALLGIRVRFQEERVPSRAPIVVELRVAARWLWRQPFLRGMTILYGGAALVLPGRGLIVIVIAERQHASAGVIGLIFAAEGIGTLLGAPLGLWSARRLPVGWAVLVSRVAGAILWLLLAFAPNAAVLAAIGFAFGLIDPIEDVPYFSYRHRLIPDALKGRVLAACRLAPSLTRPLGLVLLGVLLQRLGAVQTVLVTWLWLAALTLLVSISPAIRGAPRLTDAPVS
jgi:predicted MFS family arabinose efflux permease